MERPGVTRCLIIETSNRSIPSVSSRAYFFASRPVASSNVRRKLTFVSLHPTPWCTYRRDFTFPVTRQDWPGERLERSDASRNLHLAWKKKKRERERKKGTVAPVTRKKTKKERVVGHFAVSTSASERQKVCPCLTTFRFSFHGLHTGRDPRETELLPSLFVPPLSLSVARSPFFFHSCSFSLFLFRLVADGGRLHTRCFHSLPFPDPG